MEGSLIKSQFVRWSLLAAALMNGEEEFRSAKCPKCGESYLASRAAGDVVQRVGYLAVWCESCWTGIWISRVKVPAEFLMLTLEESEHEGMPEFRRVDP
jgi:hypothetical protein